MEDKEAPVKTGDVIVVEIVSVGRKGDGVAKHSGYVVFVPGAKRGQKVKVEITKVYPQYAFGIMLGTA